MVHMQEDTVDAAPVDASTNHYPPRHRWARRLIAIPLVVAALAASLAASLAGRDAVADDTWAKKLGYGDDQRVVILYATQMGMCSEANQAGRRYLNKGLVSSAGAMAPCPWFGDFAQWCRQHPKADIGLSLTMTSEWKNYRWRPISPRSEVPHLVDGDGYLAKSVSQFTYNARPEEVEREIEAQIAAARAAGLQPGHLAPHLGALFSRPDVLAVYLAAARKHWIPAVVIDLTPERIAQFREAGIPVDPDTADLVKSYPLPKLDDLQFMPRADTYEQKREALFELVRNLKPGITKIVLQPATESEGLKRITDDWQQRVWDGRILADPKVQEFLKAEGIVLTNWKEMMRRFDGEAKPGGKAPNGEIPSSTVENVKK